MPDNSHSLDGWKGRLAHWSRRHFPLRASDVQFYRVCDDLSGVLIFLMALFSPWAFGTTEPWSIWIMNAAGGTLGILLLPKLFIRHAKGYTAPRWGNFSVRPGHKLRRHRHQFSRWLVRLLAGLTLAVLGYCLISLKNSAATYDPDLRIFTYRHCIEWLPHTFDRHRTESYFWMYLGLAGAFWGIRDWLLGMNKAEERAIRSSAEKNIPLPVLPTRLRRLLWLLCVNGALLGAEAIFQRVSGSNKLLFVRATVVNPDCASQFGPYAYRSNAAQYFNLLWPLCLGFWWTLQRASGLRVGVHHLLLLCAAIMAACPVISSSRGGALVAAGIFVLAAIFMTVTNFLARARWGTSVMLGLFFALAISLGWYFGWDTLAPRLAEASEGFQGREEMFAAAQPMAKDYPVYGTGPGSFATVFQLYRFSNATYWPEQLHNDWLETQITFGLAGLALLLAALACVGLRWFAPGGIRGGRRFVILAWLGLVGCLIEARYDFPFQVHSVLFLFLLICAVVFNLGRRSGGSQH